MEIINYTDDLKLDNTVITLGKFDGDHLGHRLLFETAVRLKEGGLKSVIFTFDIHPGNILNKNIPMKYIITEEERDMSDYPEGIDCLIRFPFNKETMSITSDSFIRDILVNKLGVKKIVAGSDFRFGKGREGSIDTLKKAGIEYGFTVHEIDKVRVMLEGYSYPVEISSTLIKEEIQKGNMENARAMLGKPFFITGEVMRGKHLGNTMGFPTVNICPPSDKVMPPNGVYATWTIIDGMSYNSMTNVGIRPTFDDGTHISVETNIFDFDRDIYGEKVTVEFCHFIRPEKKFSGIEELKNAIYNDREMIKAYFAG